MKNRFIHKIRLFGQKSVFLGHKISVFRHKKTAFERVDFAQTIVLCGQPSIKGAVFRIEHCNSVDFALLKTHKKCAKMLHNIII